MDRSPGPSFTKLFRRTKFVNAIKRHSAANFVRQIHVENDFVNWPQVFVRPTDIGKSRPTVCLV